MKKVLFGLLGLALATTALATHTTPSTQQMVDSMLEATEVGDVVGAGVPFEVRVNVVPKGPELVIVDENNNVYDEMVFDHGNKLAGTQNRSVVEKVAILTRTDGHAFSANKDGEAGKTTYTGKFGVVPNNNYDQATHVLTLEKLFSNGEDGSAPTLATEFNFISAERNIKATDKEMRTQVQSVIKAGTHADQGTYIGNGTFTAELKVKSIN